VVVVLDLNKNIGRSTDLMKKKHGSADLHTPIHPLLTTISDCWSKTIVSNYVAWLFLQFFITENDETEVMR